MNLLEALDRAPENNKEINESIVITHDKLSRYKKILCTISGGSDSDIVLDLCEQFDESKKITYVYFDTGLEFEATKRHLNYLEERYGVTIYYSSLSMESLAPFFFALFLLAGLNILKHHASDYPCCLRTVLPLLLYIKRKIAAQPWKS